jgi:hypothetical protein
VGESPAFSVDVTYDRRKTTSSVNAFTAAIGKTMMRWPKLKEYPDADVWK